MEFFWNNPIFNQNQFSISTHIRYLIIKKKEIEQLAKKPNICPIKECLIICMPLKRDKAIKRNNDFIKYIISQFILKKNSTRKIQLHKSTIFTLKNQDKNCVIITMVKLTFLENIYQPFFNQTILLSTVSEINAVIDTPLSRTLSSKYFSSSEVKIFINNFRTGKTPGYDIITAKITGKLFLKIIIKCTNIINIILRLVYSDSMEICIL